MGENMKKTWSMKDEFSLPVQKVLGNDKDIFYAKCCDARKSFEFDDEKCIVHVVTYQDCVFNNKKEFEIYKKNLDAVQRFNGWGECVIEK